MNALWLVPVIVLAIGMGIVAYLARDAARAARELGAGVARFSAVRTAFTGLAEQSSELRRRLAEHDRK